MNEDERALRAWEAMPPPGLVQVENPLGWADTFEEQLCVRCERDSLIRSDDGRRLCSILGRVYSGEPVPEWYAGSELANPYCQSFRERGASARKAHETIRRRRSEATVDLFE